MVNSMRRYTSDHLLGILFLMAMVCCLCCSLYGLKQRSLWLVSAICLCYHCYWFLSECSWYRLVYSCFIPWSKSSSLCWLYDHHLRQFWVHCLCKGTSQWAISHAWSQWAFSCMVLVLFVTFLRTEVSSTSDGLYMSHGKYIQDLVDRFSTIPNILELCRRRTSLKSILLTNWWVHTDFGVTCYVIRSFVTSGVLDFVGVWSEIQFGVKTSVGILIIWKNDKCYMILRHTSKDVLTIRLEEKTCKSNQNFINLDSAMSFIFHDWIYINIIAKEFIQFSIFHPR